MHRLSSSFILGYHGCDQAVGEGILGGTSFRPSKNKYDWLGPGIYFWESNPLRGLDFAREASGRRSSQIKKPFVIGAIIDLGMCLDLTTTGGLEWVKIAYKSFTEVAAKGSMPIPKNSGDGLRRNLDCAVITHLHSIIATARMPQIDTVKGIFTEGEPVYPGAGFAQKTHIQICVCNPACIKGVFRVPSEQLQEIETNSTT